MSDRSKIQAGHLGRIAYVYVRQSTPHQLEHNRESTQRQYALVESAAALGWRAEQIQVIDEDLGLSGAASRQPAAGQGDAHRAPGGRSPLAQHQ